MIFESHSGGWVAENPPQTLDFDLWAGTGPQRRPKRSQESGMTLRWSPDDVPTEWWSLDPQRLVSGAKNSKKSMVFVKFCTFCGIFDNGHAFAELLQLIPL